MTFSMRIFLGYFLVVGIGAYFVINTLMEELKPGVRQSMEDTLVDTANLLAEIAQPEIKQGTIANGNFARSVGVYAERRPNAKIWGFSKNRVSHRIYVTDAKGIVLFDSSGKDVGRDYSRWNDVYLTLRGKYGARTTRSDPNNEASSVMYVAAPILDGNRIIGVVTVAKPNISVQPFIDASEQKMTRAGLIMIAAALAIGLILSFWFSNSIQRLSRYAADVSAGRRAQLPRLGGGELKTLGDSIESMRSKLEGKHYVERYTLSLTHELKSPVSAILGALELIDEHMPAEQRERFVNNIRDEAQRIQVVVERLLDLARVEHMQVLENPEPVDLAACIDEVVQSKRPALERKRLRIETPITRPIAVSGEAFLLRQALANLLDNAIDFSPVAGVIRISSQRDAHNVKLEVHNLGDAIPPYAQARLFERFYSLPRPDGGKKSTGLGLPFVKEVALLHGGDISVSNVPDGVSATLSLPLLRTKHT